MEKVSFSLERVVFKRENFSILSLSTNDNIPMEARENNKFPAKRQHKFTALFSDIADITATLKKNKEYCGEGDWKKGKYGLQFSMQTVTQIIGTSRREVMAYLIQLDGIGNKTAGYIYDAFGADSVRVIEEEPAKLLQIKGVSQNKLKKIVDSLAEANAFKRITDYFSKFSLNSRKIRQIYEAFGDMSVDICNDNPYSLCQINGLTFQDVDFIAVDLNTKLDSPERILHGLKYAFDLSLNAKGHLFLHRQDIIDATARLLNKNSNSKIITAKMVDSVFQKALDEGCFVQQKTKLGDVIYRMSDYLSESEVGKRLVDFNKNPAVLKLSREKILSDITNVESKIGFKLSNAQKEAVITSLNSGISVITGGPGTGKTTILRFILEIFKENFNSEIQLCAPTGRAARRMAESTGFMEANTIHHLLGLNELSDISEKQELQPINASLVVADEASMIDMSLMSALIQSIPFNCKVIFLGDADQLPSVGPGNVLREIIASGCVPCSTLDVIFRQKETSKIVLNSDKLKHGDTDYDYDDTFYMILESNDAQVEQDIVDVYMEEISKPGCNIDNVQILTPYKAQNKAASVYILNEKIQALVNPKQAHLPEVKVGKVIFRINDKVIQQKNSDMIKNGDVGYVKNILFDNGEVSLIIEFSDNRMVSYCRADIEDYMVNLAYVITIHKSQGSEYKTVIMPIIKSHSFMLNKNLIYTAWTRAKENVIMVGDESTLKKCSKICNIDTRNTFLRYWMMKREKQYNKKQNKRRGV